MRYNNYFYCHTWIIFVHYALWFPCTPSRLIDGDGRKINRDIRYVLFLSSWIPSRQSHHHPILTSLPVTLRSVSISVSISVSVSVSLVSAPVPFFFLFFFFFFLLLLFLFLTNRCCCCRLSFFLLPTLYFPRFLRTDWAISVFILEGEEEVRKK